MNPKREYDGRLTRRLRAAIAKAPMTQRELSRRAGIAEGLLSRFMRRKIGATMRTADALAEVLNLDLVSGGPVKVPPKQKPGRKPKRKRGGADKRKGV